LITDMGERRVMPGTGGGRVGRPPLKII